MCDTLVATPPTTASRAMLFAKNSDRQPNEAQAVDFFAAAGHAPGDDVRCTYITIPQERSTYAVLLCRPFWMWGAEMGVNEHGVAIGNEGLHARIPAPEPNALTGMDLVRLALERAASAREAVETVTTLLAAHGQGGNCGHLTPSFYNNGFMIADPDEAFVVETVGREWLVEPVQGTRALSNIYSVGRSGVRTSRGITDVIRAGGLEDDGVSDYAPLITNPEREHLGHACARRTRSSALLESEAGHLDARAMMKVLRDHGAGPVSGDWHPARSEGISICMHASHRTPGQTVGSLVSELVPRRSVHWLTATALPCTSIFKPLFTDTPVPVGELRPDDRFDARVYWWYHESMNRAAQLGDFNSFLEGIASERDGLEKSFRERVAAVMDASSEERAHVVDRCWSEAMAAERTWHARIVHRTAPLDARFLESWRELTTLAGLHLLTSDKERL